MLQCWHTYWSWWWELELWISGFLLSLPLTAPPSLILPFSLSAVVCQAPFPRLPRYKWGPHSFNCISSTAHSEYQLKSCLWVDTEPQPRVQTMANPSDFATQHIDYTSVYVYIQSPGRQSRNAFPVSVSGNLKSVLAKSLEERST